jgi:tRNA-2-methylthio-N6-dimethylallyladenosine synthase
MSHIETGMTESTNTNDKPSVYVHTFGCQMNVHDSQKIMTLLGKEGYNRAEAAEDADVILVNTCSVREKPEHKVMSLVGRYRLLKEENPELVIGVGGCFARQEGEGLIKRSHKAIDLVFGPDNIPELPKMLEQFTEVKKPVVETAFDNKEAVRFLDIAHDVLDTPHSAMVTIMKGCDKYCSFCIVPHVRGRERYRSPSHILDEIKNLVSEGVREVLLLGQSVTSWEWKQDDHHFRLHDLLRFIADESGLDRLRFTSPYPRDFSDDLIACFSDIDMLCDHVHLPFQSGSNEMLYRMNRRHTRDQYFEWVDKLRAARPHLALTADVIVGFPGETDEDFAQTMDLIERVRFDNLFSFIYSTRPGTPAKRKEQIDEAVKKQRLATLQDCQKQITWEKNQELEGQILTVLVDGPSRQDGHLQGRTSGNKLTHFVADESLIGQIVPVRITSGRPHSLMGELV